MDGRDPRSLVLLDGANHVDRVAAVAVVGVGDNRNLDRSHDAPGVVDHLAHGQETDGGAAQERGGRTEPVMYAAPDPASSTSRAERASNAPGASTGAGPASISPSLPGPEFLCIRPDKTNSSSSFSYLYLRPPQPPSGVSRAS